MAHRSEHDSDGTAEPGKNQSPGKLGYKIFASLGAAAGATVARKVLTASWKKATGKEPPDNPEHPDVRWGEAMSWAIASAGAVAAAKLMAQRRVAATWRRASGTLPPGLDNSVK